SLAGRIGKERYALIGVTARDHARDAIECYARAFGISGSAYPAINAATMAMLVGDMQLAHGLARDGLAALGGVGDHWHHASAGEASLILGSLEDAARHYATAHRLAGGKFGDVASMRRQLRLIGS